MQEVRSCLRPTVTAVLLRYTLLCSQKLCNHTHTHTRARSLTLSLVSVFTVVNMVSCPHPKGSLCVLVVSRVPPSCLLFLLAASLRVPMGAVYFLVVCLYFIYSSVLHSLPKGQPLGRSKCLRCAPSTFCSHVFSLWVFRLP